MKFKVGDNICIRTEPKVKFLVSEILKGQYKLWNEVSARFLHYPFDVIDNVCIIDADTTIDRLLDKYK